MVSDKIKWRSFLVGKAGKDVMEWVSHKLSSGGEIPCRERRESEKAMGQVLVTVLS